MRILLDPRTWQRVATRLLNEGHLGTCRRVQQHLQCGAYDMVFDAADAPLVAAAVDAVARQPAPPRPAPRPDRTRPTPTADAAEAWLRATA